MFGIVILFSQLVKMLIIHLFFCTDSGQKFFENFTAVNMAFCITARPFFVRVK